MAKKQVDKYYLFLYCIKNKIAANRLIGYLYLYQMAGFNLNFKYKVTGSGMKSSDVTTYLNNLISKGLVEVKKGILSLIDKDNILDILESKYNICEDDKECLEDIRIFADSLDYDVLYFICITNLVMSDMLSKLGDNFLYKSDSKEQLQNIIRELCFEYSEEDFNVTLRIIRNIKERNFNTKFFKSLKIERKINDILENKDLYNTFVVN